MDFFPISSSLFKSKMEAVQLLTQTVENSNIYQVLHLWQEKYIVSLLLKTEFTRHLVQHTPSKVVTLILVYIGIFLAIYEIILNTGVHFGAWTHPADEVFAEIPVHCAHVYVSIQVIVDDNKLLKNPIVYHFEFSPDEYSHEEYGTDLKFLRGKVLDWFKDSQVYYLNKDKFNGDIDENDLSLYNKKGKKLQGDDSYLCDLDVNTGETVMCVIQG